MSTSEWFRAHLRWAVMVRGKEGLCRWEESVFIFLSENRGTATMQALRYGRQREGSRGERGRNIQTRFAEIVTLDCLGTDQSEFAVSLGACKPKVKLPFEHVFDPEARAPPEIF